MYDLSWLNPTPHATAVYASCSALLPPHATLASRRPATALPGPDLHRLIAPAFLAPSSMRATVTKPTLRRPGRSLFWATKRTGGASSWSPQTRGASPRKRGDRAPERRGCPIAPWGARRLRSGAPMTPEGASAPDLGRTPPGALPRHFHESGFAHEPLPDRGALLQALSRPVLARLRVILPAGRWSEAAPGA